MFLIKRTKISNTSTRLSASEMESNSRDCEASTYTQSSGYNSSTASSSLNYIDDDNLSTVIEASCSKQIDADGIKVERQPITTLIITITLLKIEKKVFSLSTPLVRLLLLIVNKRRDDGYEED